MLAWNEPIGKAIRWPLRLIPKSANVPILSGPNRGLKWRVGGSTHGSWIGSYERKSALVLRSLCRPGMVAFDVGANAGYFTLLLSRASCLQGRVLAFEPDPGNLAILRHHLQINGVANVSVMPLAVTDRDGETAFDCAASMGRISSSGSTIVRTTQLDQFATPDLIKMDIEGAEALALLGAQRILSERRTIWFIELHGDQAKPSIDLLKTNGYRVRNVGSCHILAEPEGRNNC
jgi:FkbM family methyltransferase